MAYIGLVESDTLIIICLLSFLYNIIPLKLYNFIEFYRICRSYSTPYSIRCALAVVQVQVGVLTKKKFGQGIKWLITLMQTSCWWKHQWRNT